MAKLSERRSQPLWTPLTATSKVTAGVYLCGHSRSLIDEADSLHCRNHTPDYDNHAVNAGRSPDKTPISKRAETNVVSEEDENREMRARKGANVESQLASTPRLRKLSVYGVDFYTGHTVLRDCAKDFSRALERPLSAKADVYVGVHVVDQPYETGRFRVGIQTEQLLDRNGQVMWRNISTEALWRYANQYDLILDLSPDNEPSYQGLSPELRAKVFFGPHVFPNTPIELDYKLADPLFFGSLNARRRLLLAEQQALRPITVAPKRTFGQDLDSMIKMHGSVFNLHFVDGEYSEYPRFLKAYLRGKPVVSEPMSEPLQSGVHYFNLDSIPSEDAARRIFKNVADWSREYSFQRFLERAV